MNSGDSWLHFRDRWVPVEILPKIAAKTKLVTIQGIFDTKNGIMLYSIVEAESHETAAIINRWKAIRICRFRSPSSKSWR
jgi:hypothetical protein